MRSYGIIRGRFWGAGSGKKLRGKPEAQTLAAYLMTCEQGTMCGIFRIALPTIAHETGLPLERLQELFEAIREIAVYDEDEELCWVPNSAREQLGETLKSSDNKWKGLIRELREFSAHRYFAEFLDIYWDAYELERSSFKAPRSHSQATLKPLQSPSGAVVVETEGASKPQGKVSHRQVPGEVSSEGVQGEVQSPSSLVSCPPDLALTAGEMVQLEQSVGMTAEFVERATPYLRAKFISDDPRTLPRWKKTLVTALTGVWNNKPKRDELLGKLLPAPQGGHRTRSGFDPFERVARIEREEAQNDQA